MQEVGSGGARSFWTRALWMRLGALNGLVALIILLQAKNPIFGVSREADIHLAAQVQFMHGMATISCATFMNIGAKGARLAPAFFLSGVLLYSVQTYVEAAGLIPPLMPLRYLGLGAFAIGWLIMAWASKDIDRG